VHAFIDLAGSDASPKASYRATTLYGTAAPTRGDALPLD
jgi:hypothetical protein